ncbi:MAG: molybdopterin-guanine dinucleotide biosynthesis protein B-like protein, partial [Paenibacillus sp.]|nr:molybdopterin-guanine dinucleotide biosynthesis protein B-like protein [Paenibacillus sp.]
MMAEHRAGLEGKGHRPAVIQVVGYKNTGKTTIVCQLTSLLKEAGYKVGTIKHDAHEFRMDHPGTDTWKHQQSGA